MTLIQIISLSTKEDLRLMAEISTVNRAIASDQRFFNNNKDETVS